MCLVFFRVGLGWTGRQDPAGTKGAQESWPVFKDDIHQKKKKKKVILTNLTLFYDEITGFVDEEKTVNVTYLDFNKTFNTISDSALVTKLRENGLYGWALMWLKNWQENFGKESSRQRLKVQLVPACECHPLGTDIGTNVVYLHVLLIFIMLPESSLASRTVSPCHLYGWHCSGEWVTSGRAALPFTGTSMGCGNGLTGTSRSTTKGNTCIWDEITPCTGIGWVILDWH